MQFFIRKPWELPQRFHTTETAYRSAKLARRAMLGRLGWGTAAIAAGGLFSGCRSGTDEEILKAGDYESGTADDTSSSTAVEGENSAATREEPDEEAEPAAASGPYPAARNAEFEYGRDETREADAARYTNFYEFSATKSVWMYVKNFQPLPWQVEVTGLCAKPRTFDLDDLLREMNYEERHYRHRCVETWAMCVPWTGFPLAELLRRVEPMARAKFVGFETFNDPQVATNLAQMEGYPWPYTEGLTIDEAMNPLSFIATGMYGHTLLKQHGAPLRLVVPWKYGFKSIKSIVRIVLADQPPATFWNTINPLEYDFEANVNPKVPHPRWSQQTEWMLGTREQHPTVIYNGYGDWVAKLYSS